MKVSEIMHKVFSVEKDITLLEAAKLFTRKDINSLVLIKDGAAIGIVTDRDIIRHIADVRKKKMTEVMTKKLITIEYDASLEEAVELMRVKKIGRLLVVDEQKTLIGILTAKDIIANADVLNKLFSFM